MLSIPVCPSIVPCSLIVIEVTFTPASLGINQNAPPTYCVVEGTVKVEV